MPNQVPQEQFYGKLPQGGRRTNKEIGREREYLRVEEVKALREAAKRVGRYGHRDYTAILLTYRHGLRAKELCELTWDLIDFKGATIDVKRCKKGNSSRHRLEGDELRALRELHRDNPSSKYVFLSERGTPMSTDSFHNLVQRAGKEAEIPFAVHPHMLRHAKGHSLANKGHDTRLIQDFLGHRNIASTVRYTQLAEGRLKDLSGD